MEEGIAAIIADLEEMAKSLCRICPIKRDCAAGALHPETRQFSCRVTEIKKQIESIKRRTMNSFTAESFRSTLSAVDRKYRSIFQSEFKRVYNHELSIAVGRILINLDAFECVMDWRHGVGEDDSLENIVRQNYGDEAVDFLRSLL